MKGKVKQIESVEVEGVWQTLGILYYYLTEQAKNEEEIDSNELDQIAQIGTEWSSFEKINQD